MVPIYIQCDGVYGSDTVPLVVVPLDSAMVPTFLLASRREFDDVM